MSEETKENQEEAAIEKTYDLRVTLRLLGYLKPYWKMAAVALVLTLAANILLSMQPRFTQYAIDDFITPKQTEGIWLFAFSFFCLFFSGFCSVIYRKFCSMLSGKR